MTLKTLAGFCFLLLLLNGCKRKAEPKVYQVGEDWDAFGFFTFQNRQTDDPSYTLRQYMPQKGIQPILVPMGPSEKTQWVYDSKGQAVRFTRITDRDGAQTEKTIRKLDASGRLKEVVIEKLSENGDAYQRDTIGFGYDEDSKINYLYQYGMKTYYTRNDKGWITTRRSVGKGMEGEDYDNKTTYTYDDKGRLLTERNPEINGQQVEVTVSYHDEEKDGMFCSDITYYRMQKTNYRGEKNTTETHEQYREVYDREGRLAEYHKVGEFDNYILYDESGRVSKIFRIGKKYPEFPRVKQIKYDTKGRIVSEAEHNLTNFTNTKVYQTGSLIESKVYNHQNRTYQVSGSMVENHVYTGKFKYFN